MRKRSRSLLSVCVYVWSSHVAEYGLTGRKVVNPARGQLDREN